MEGWSLRFHDLKLSRRRRHFSHTFRFVIFRVVPVPNLSLENDKIKAGVDHPFSPFKFKLSSKHKNALTDDASSAKVETGPNMAAARLLKDFYYYFLVILAAPLSHTRKGNQFYDGCEKMRTISCPKEITFGRRIFIAFDFKPEQFKTTYIQQTNHN